MSESPKIGETLCSPARTTKVQVVDDEVFIVKLVSKVLRDLGYEVMGSTSPLEVVTLLRADPGAFDLLVTDLDMPELHGHELIGQVRLLRPALPIVVLTGNMPTESEQIADRYLNKPCTNRSLSRALHEALQLRS